VFKWDYPEHYPEQWVVMPAHDFSWHDLTCDYSSTAFWGAVYQQERLPS